MPIVKQLSQSSSNIRIVQITDSHLGANPGDMLLNMDADKGLKDVLELMSDKRPSPDLILATGDIGNHPDVDAYSRFLATVREASSSPLCWIPGNHDDPKLMEAARGRPYEQVIDCGNWRIIMLNSRVPNHTYGHLDDSELNMLEEILSSSADKHVMICLHHQPVPIGSAWMDSYIVDNAHDFWRVVEGHSCIRAVVWGHVHQEFEDTYNDIRLISTPATCIQFVPNQDHFGVDRTMPGYRWFELKENGSIDTGVERVAFQDYGIDFDSKGY